MKDFDRSVFEGIEDGEMRVIKLVKEMSGEETIHNVILERKFGEPEPDEPARPIGPMDIKVKDLTSFVGVCEQYGDTKQSVVFYDRSGLVFVRDMLQEKGINQKRDIATLSFAFSSEFDAWRGAIGRYAKHKDFLQFLKMNKNDILNSEILISSYGSISTAVNLKRDAQYDDGLSYTVKYSSKTEGGTSNKPIQILKGFDISIPVLDNDDFEKFPVEIEIEEPERIDEEAKFYLRSREFDKAKEIAVKNQIELLRQELKGWLILYGSPDNSK